METKPLLSNDKRCPEKKSWFFSRITFSWFTPLVIQGKQESLKQSDLWNLDEEKTTLSIVERFEKCGKKEKTAVIHAEKCSKSCEYGKLYSEAEGGENKDDQATEYGILKPMVKAFWLEFFLAAVYCFIASCLQFVGPIVLSYLIAFVAGEGPEWLGWLCVALIFLSSAGNSLFNAQHENLVNVVSMKMRSCMIHAIYNKSLKLSTLGQKDFTVGEIVNLMAVDTQKIVDFIPRVNLLWATPFQIGVATCLLWKQLGVACFAGLAVMILMVPFIGLINAKLRTYQMKVMRQKDRRAQLMNELLNGVKVVKLFSWEEYFGSTVRQIRNKELSLARVVGVLTAAVFLSFGSATFLFSLASFATFVLIDERNILDPTKVFVSLSLFNIIRIPINLMFMAISFCIMAMVSVRRINKFLNCEEVNQSNVTRHLDDTHAIAIQEGTFTWGKDCSPVLEDIHLFVPHGKLVAVVGEVGSGKSSLLAAILGVLEKKSGNVNVSGSIAYVPQQAWILNDTVRQNILFAKPLDRIKYKAVLEACALEPDLKILEGGDMCEIGEKGINLSGGQKQRVSLARAVFSDADIYLLDDPLSAVDSHVSKHLFDQVIGPKGLLKSKTRVLVSHRLTVLPKVDQIIVLKNGRISEQGTYSELIEKRGDFAEMIVQYLDQEMDNIEDKEEIAVIKDLLQKVGSDVEHRRESYSNISSKGSRRRSRVHSTSSTVASGKGSVEDSTVNRRTAKLIENEGLGEGSIKWSVYKHYFSAMGYFPVIVTVFIFLLANGLEIFLNLWLSFWSNDYIDASVANNTHEKFYRLNVYASFGLIQAGSLLVAAVLVALLCLKAARSIHNMMLDRVLFAPMSFFDTTPMGRIQNRFTRDIDTLDLTIQPIIRIYIQTLFMSIVRLFLTGMETAWSLLVVFPLGIVYIILQRYYIATSRQLRRIESVTRSPIYSHFSQTVSGIDSIHAYGVSDIFVNRCYKLVDLHHAANYLTIVAGQWLAVRLEMLGYIVVTLAALFAVINRESVTPGIVGLSVSVSMSLTVVLNFLVRTSTDLETNSVSVERCIEYKDVPVEAPRHMESTKPKSTWPDRGQVSFFNYSTRYRVGLDLVLKNVNFDIEPGQKVGVVGRTGAGKSSLALALFRIIEPVSGKIVIDNVDITKIGLHDLRSRLTIIPQDPVLFSGTIRMNLDPCQENSTDDDILWRALDLAHLSDFVRSTADGLSYEVVESGENLSVGQRQLLCLARAILRKSKILVLDEATAAVDVETDELIQKTIRSEFKDCTVLTIAHRLNTVMDYDKILVLSAGQVAEYDAPQALLENVNSVFYGMAKDANLV